MPTPSILIYILLFLVVLTVYFYSRQRRADRAAALQKQQQEAGLTEPMSLHPVIDPHKCIACGSCADACPEHNVLGIVNGRGALIAPANCIGHGACRTACPVDAITLVFGSEKRGVDIPLVGKDFQTNVPGVYIAGELGGMGLIRNAVNQGRQAMEAIAAKVKKNGPKEGVYDVVIVGSGPAGFSASLAAKEAGLRFVTLEQETLGGTVAHYPRSKLVMTQPMVMPIIGKTNFTEISKEELLKFWQDIEAKTDLKINYMERVEKVVPQGALLSVQSTSNNYTAQAVLLTIGRRGTPRKLGVPGENTAKVVYRLIDPAQYRGKHVLVVGGGDSALEAALSVAKEEGTTVTLSYRGESFGRVKLRNRELIDDAQKKGRIQVLLNSNVLEVREKDIAMEQKGMKSDIINDVVIVCAGGVLPTPFLKEIGINVETKYGTA